MFVGHATQSLRAGKKYGVGASQLTHVPLTKKGWLGGQKRSYGPAGAKFPIVWLAADGFVELAANALQEWVAGSYTVPVWQDIQSLLTTSKYGAVFGQPRQFVPLK